LSLAVNVLKVIPWDSTPKGYHRFLDFGCGYGSLVEALQSEYFSCIGFETSESRLERHKTRNLQTYGDWEDVVRRGPYSAIFLSEVIEHVADPKEVVQLIRSVLQPQGVIAITVPNFSSKRVLQNLLLAEKGEIFTPELNPWEHLNYFSGTSLRRLIVECGFQEIESEVDIGIRPGLSGIRRIGNCVKSMVRLMQYNIGQLPKPTQVIAKLKD
jgi:SAM-dependent methyltransferase